jgi:hypothetical protein
MSFYRSSTSFNVNKANKVVEVCKGGKRHAMVKEQTRVVKDTLDKVVKYLKNDRLSG